MSRTSDRSVTNFCDKIGMESRTNKNGYNGVTDLMNDVFGIRYVLSAHGRGSTFYGFETLTKDNNLTVYQNDGSYLYTPVWDFYGTRRLSGTGGYSAQDTIPPEYEDPVLTLNAITGDVIDSIGPVSTAANISYSNDGSTVLTLTFSEGLDCENEADANYFIYLPKQTNVERQDVVPDILSKDKKNKWKLIFRSARNDKEAYIPVMGDSIKLVPGVHADLLHRSTPDNNPFVRISGEQNVVITSAPVVTIGESDSSKSIIKNPNPTVPKIVQEDKPMTAKEVAESYGAQGHYLGDLSLSSLVKDEVSALESAIKNVNAKNIENNGKNLETILTEVQTNQISLDQANKMYNLGPEIVTAYLDGIITANDVTGIANGNTSVIEKITREYAKLTVLEYKTQYFTSLGVFVNNTSGVLTCVDTLYNGSCLDDDKDGKIFLAWNMRSKKGRLVGTGVYIARLTYKIRIGRSTKADRTQDFIWGVRHGKTKGFTIDLNE